MAIHQIKMIREMNLDHEKVCGSCGYIFKVISRVYSESFDSYGSSFFTNPGARAQQRVEERSAVDLAKKTKNIKDYHRCTKCGLYDQKDIQKFRELYPFYLKRVKTRKLNNLIWGILLGLFSISPWVIMSIKKETPSFSLSENMISLIFMFILFILSIVIIRSGLRMWPKQESEYIQNLNSPETCSRWLKNWNKKSNQQNLEEIFYRNLEVDERETRWESISSKQHYLDPL